MLLRLAVFFVICFSRFTMAQAQSRDDEIFGGAPPNSEIPSSPAGKAAATATPPANAATSSSSMDKSLVDPLAIGGRLELRLNSSEEEHQSFGRGASNQLKRADIYFDTRPNQELRAFLRGRLSETYGTVPGSNAAPITTTQQDIDELWLKWDYAKTLFFTVGKQHLKWGSGKLWNPTDFTAAEVRDPFALFDQRLGQEMIKIHIPQEKQGFNYYLIMQYHDAQRNDDLAPALRAEFALGGIAELALSFQTRRGAATRYGLDLSSGLGPVDVHMEAALSHHESRWFYQGSLDPSTGALPTAVRKEKDWFEQVVVGVQKTWQYSDEDNLTLGAEYFHNGLGYHDRALEMLSLLTQQSQGLYAGDRYAGLYITAPTPGSWNKTSFYLNGIENLADDTGVVRFTTAWELHRYASVEAFVGRCFGDAGELCFRLPDQYRFLANAPILTPEQQTAVSSLPSRRTLLTAGLGFIMNF